MNHKKIPLFGEMMQFIQQPVNAHSTIFVKLVHRFFRKLSTIKPELFSDYTTLLSAFKYDKNVAMQVLYSAYSDFDRELLQELVKSNKDCVLQAFSSVYPEFAQRALSYAQEGEDLILARMFAGIENGFYVDIGAHHPFRFSNTYLLYLRGWKGVNIDASPGSMKLFDIHRPRDINIEALVGLGEKSQKFFLFDEAALNTASPQVLQERLTNDTSYRLACDITVTPRPLSAILAEVIPKEQNIEVMSIDVEGLEMEILQSNDWKMFSPKVVLLEQLNCDIVSAPSHPTTLFLADHNYKLIFKSYNTSFFERRS